MADELRSCRKTACRWPAAASLSFRYATKEVWLLDLSVEADPSLYDLCPHHADALTVPNGWTRVDQRSSVEAPVEPAAADRISVQTSSAHRSGRGATSMGSTQSADVPTSRYAALAQDLPRLAAEWANGNGGWPTEEPLTHAPAVVTDEMMDVPGQLAIPVEDRDPRADAVVVSIELARRPT